MKECVEVDGLSGLIGHLRNVHPAYGPPFDPKISISPYSGPDDRIGWKQTCIVIQEGWGPIGFTDECQEQKP